MPSKSYLYDDDDDDDNCRLAVDLPVDQVGGPWGRRTWLGPVRAGTPGEPSPCLSAPWRSAEVIRHVLGWEPRSSAWMVQSHRCLEPAMCPQHRNTSLYNTGMVIPRKTTQSFVLYKFWNIRCSNALFATKCSPKTSVYQPKQNLCKQIKHSLPSSRKWLHVHSICYTPVPGQNHQKSHH